MLYDNSGKLSGKIALRGWYDIQGQGVNNDYCRPVGDVNNAYIACKLAGSDNEYTTNYNKETKFNPGTFLNPETNNLPNRIDGKNCSNINTEFTARIKQ